MKNGKIIEINFYKIEILKLNICRILTGCYDNTVHIWTSKGKHKLTIPGHSAPIKSVKWISLDPETGTFVRLISKINKIIFLSMYYN